MNSSMAQNHKSRTNHILEQILLREYFIILLLTSSFLFFDNIYIWIFLCDMFKPLR